MTQSSPAVVQDVVKGNAKYYQDSPVTEAATSYGEAIWDHFTNHMASTMVCEAKTRCLKVALKDRHEEAHRVSALQTDTP